jgi:hypothetical protein
VQSDVLVADDSRLFVLELAGRRLLTPQAPREAASLNGGAMTARSSLKFFAVGVDPQMLTSEHIKYCPQEVADF